MNTCLIKIRIWLCIVLTCCFATKTPGQNISDTTELEFGQFMEIVSNHHPIAMAANLQTAKGDASLLKAKGELDPEIAATLGEKHYAGSRYYSLLNAGLNIPTWYGVDFSAGFDQTGGVYLNPENRTPQGGLLYAGLSVPIGQGLIIDERRAVIREAKVYRKILESERRQTLNDLYFQAGAAYWDWYEAYTVRSIYLEAVQVSEERLQNIKQSIKWGAGSPIDTLEASIQVRNRKISFQEADLKYKNARLYLSLYLWADGTVPLELQELTIPSFNDSLTNAVLDMFDGENTDSLISSHPLINRYDAELEQIDIKSKWQKEQLKPTLNLKYNFLTEPVGDNLWSDVSFNNYKWGIEFSTPILVRKERGALKMLEIQAKEIAYEQDFKQQALKQQLLQSMNTLNTNRQQYLLYKQISLDYGKLLEGEKQMFFNGESSLFMINSREIAFIGARTQLVNVISDYQKTYLEIVYKTGTLWNNW